MTRYLRFFPAVSCAFLLSACAAQQAPSASCELAPAELEQVQASALAYVLREHPAMEARCEAISDSIVTTDTGKCAIAGGPTGADGCAKPSHVEYSIVFDRETLAPEKIYFKTE